MVKKYTDSDGTAKTVDQWFKDPRRVVTSRNGLERRLEAGWTVEDALAKPAQIRTHTCTIESHRTYLDEDGKIQEVTLPPFGVIVNPSAGNKPSDIIVDAVVPASQVMSHWGTIPGVYRITVTLKGASKTWLSFIPSDMDPLPVATTDCAAFARAYLTR